VGTAEKQPGAPTAETVTLETQGLEQKLNNGTISPQERSTLAQRERDAVKAGAGLSIPVLKIVGEPPVPADAKYAKGANDPAYIADSKKWGQAVLQATQDPAQAKAHQAEVGKMTGVVNAAIMKAQGDYRKAAEAQRALTSFVDAANSGNKVTAAAVPLEGTLDITTSQGVKRINKNELEGIGGAGSLFDQIAGKVGKLAAGQPVPSDVLQDFKALAGILKQNSYQTYSDAYDQTRALYEPQGVNFSKIHKLEPEAAEKTHNFTVGTDVYSNIPADKVARFKQLHPDAKEVK
jgi:hypothetical protein